MGDRGYDEIRLETPTGAVICYFAPTFEVVPSDRNQLFEAPRSSEGSSVVRNNGLWTSELTVQGQFVHSDEAPPAFRSALQTLFGKQEVTPTDQINRLRSYTVYSDPSSLHFYHRDNEYRATAETTVDVDNGVYPAVSPTELRLPEDGETSVTRTDFMVRFAVGVERQSEPAEPGV